MIDFRIPIAPTKCLPELPDATTQPAALEPKHESIEHDGASPQRGWLENITTKHAAAAFGTTRHARHFIRFGNLDDATNVVGHHESTTQHYATITVSQSSFKITITRQEIGRFKCRQSRRHPSLQRHRSNQHDNQFATGHDRHQNELNRRFENQSEGTLGEHQQKPDDGVKCAVN